MPENRIEYCKKNTVVDEFWSENFHRWNPDDIKKTGIPNEIIYRFSRKSNNLFKCEILPIRSVRSNTIPPFLNTNAINWDVQFHQTNDGAYLLLFFDGKNSSVIFVRNTVDSEELAEACGTCAERYKTDENNVVEVKQNAKISETGVWITEHVFTLIELMASKI